MAIWTESVCLSVTLQYCIEMGAQIENVFGIEASLNIVHCVLT